MITTRLELLRAWPGIARAEQRGRLIKCWTADGVVFLVGQNEGQTRQALRDVIMVREWAERERQKPGTQSPADLRFTPDDRLRSPDGGWVPGEVSHGVESTADHR